MHMTYLPMEVTWQYFSFSSPKESGSCWCLASSPCWITFRAEKSLCRSAKHWREHAKDIPSAHWSSPPWFHVCDPYQVKAFFRLCSSGRCRYNFDGLSCSGIQNQACIFGVSSFAHHYQYLSESMVDLPCSVAIKRFPQVRLLPDNISDWWLTLGGCSWAWWSQRWWLQEEMVERWKIIWFENLLRNEQNWISIHLYLLVLRSVYFFV